MALGGAVSSHSSSCFLGLRSRVLERIWSPGTTKTRVRTDAPSNFPRRQKATPPCLPQLLQSHPALELELSCTERRVDLVREGFDCVLRLGPVDEPGLVARPLGLVADRRARRGHPRA